jgi:hypothetical protein
VYTPVPEPTPDIGSPGLAINKPSGPADEVGPFFIKGRKASNLEWRVYKALKRLRWRDDQISFQIDVLGGRMPGGAVLDFVVWTYAHPYVLEPNGDIWHTATLAQIQRDKKRYADIVKAWRRPFDYLSMGQGDIATDDMCYALLLRKVGRA